ncbi:MAG: enoyl-CoA hydratase/isomerase family protein [Burkholderiales bacterium]|nr:enoyl-CoA hydratase/isomerase family protein [Burkholderiales bacterium]
MDYSNIVLDQPEAGVYCLTVNRPKALNALNADTLDEIAAAIAQVRCDQAARALLVTGAGEKAFVAGADIAQMQSFGPADAQAFSERGHRALRALEMLPLPVIALVNGYALGGGCELALACDWIIASERAMFGQPEVNLGVVAGFGGTQRLPRLIGRARALELLVTGRIVKADEALRIGLVNQLVAPERLRETGLEVARTIASKGPVAVRLTKQMVQRGQDMDLANACQQEAYAFALTCATEDQKEGMRAFLDKRPAKFLGR